MANRFFTPNQQFSDNTGSPYAGGSLAFYASGTSTPLNTYSNQALSTPNLIPVVLDSSGRAGDVFLQNLAYKVVLSDANNNVIWTADPVYSSDFSTTASFFSGAGPPNGTTAGTQGSATIPASVYWDYANNILHVCTTTGTVLTAVWTAVNAATAAAVTPIPQGRLTLTSGIPVLSSDVTGATAVIYTPYTGNLIPVYNGATFIPTVFSELTLTLASQHVANTLYDVFAFNNSGVVTLVTGPAWTTSTAGSGARGTGAGTTQLSRVSGLLVNTVQISGRNGASTYTINANLATYLGTININSAAGQVSCTPAVGQNRIYGVWNAYNRSKILLQTVEVQASWANNAGGTIQPSFNNVANGATPMTGLAEEVFEAIFTQNLTEATPFPGANVGIGWNTISAFSGQRGGMAVGVASTLVATARYVQVPSLGKHLVTPLETSTGTALIFLGTALNYLATISYMG